MCGDGQGSRSSALIFGAGPAGLTAAYELGKLGLPSTTFERDATVGGLAKTVTYKGCLFDLGGHRFLTKVQLVERLWREVLGDDLLTRPRLSRIYYGSKFYKYPLEPLDVVARLGISELLRCGGSYLKSQIFPTYPEDNMATWMTNRFGGRLYEKFFQTYTEKVWGMPCSQIGPEWAAQRIRGLSLGAAVREAFGAHGSKGKEGLRTLSTEFLYPRRGPGMMWTRMSELIEAMGSRVHLNAPVERIYWHAGGVTGIRAGGNDWAGDQFISSLPIGDLLRSLEPAPPAPVLRAAADFTYRDFLTVGLIVDGARLFPDNWVYVHDPQVRVGRIQNYSNWSPEMTPDASVSGLGMEYFCTAGDELWRMRDADLIRLAGRELDGIGLVGKPRIRDGVVIRVPKAYPVYNATYKSGLATVREFLGGLPNLQLVGRNGQHRYNNQDHSMLGGVLAARNVAGGRFNLWELNTDQDFLEAGVSLTDEEVLRLHASQPLVPEPVRRRAVATGD